MTHNGISMDAPRNLHGRTMELAWTHDGICMDAQRNCKNIVMYIFYSFCVAEAQILWIKVTISSTLLCIVGQLAGGGFMAVAVGVSDM